MSIWADRSPELKKFRMNGRDLVISTVNTPECFQNFGRVGGRFMGKVYPPSYYITHFSRMRGREDGFDRFHRASNIFCSGQLKNFCVAILTVLNMSPSDKCNILLAGSKAAEGSGVWIPFFWKIALSSL
jgi:hypothetical protein